MNDTFSLLQKYTGISKYSGSEVITPKWVVSDMVDLLPQEVFSPNATFFDPAVKSGRFLIEIYHRLMNSEQMRQTFPNEQDRHKHIIEKQLFGFATSPTAATVVRKALYDNPLSTGNIRFTSDKLTKELIQGAFSNMKFDVVIGNPPYNNDIYLDFVTLGHQLSAQYTIMITPAKWQAKGGKKNEDFRKNIVPYMSKIVYYPDCSDVFEIGEVGGISYYLVTKTVHNRHFISVVCTKNKTINGTGIIEDMQNQVLDIKGNSIIEKLGNFKTFNIDNGQMSNTHKIYVNNLAAIGGSKKLGTYLLSKKGKLQLLAQSTITHNAMDESMFSGNFHIAFTSNNEKECNSAHSYFKTRFIRFLIFCGRCGNSVMTKEAWRFVPDPGAFDHIFTDAELYKKYGLTPDEINIIESVIKERT